MNVVHRPILLAAVTAIVAGATFAQGPTGAAPGGDAKTGAEMHERDCVACHVRRMGGDGSAMYMRPDRRVTTPAQLKAQIAVCNTELGTRYFPDEEEHLAAYLNLRYYRFGH
jgi:mono/diheme cytochrome c family protein